MACLVLILLLHLVFKQWIMIKAQSVSCRLLLREMGKKGMHRRDVKLLIGLAISAKLAG